MTTLYTNRQLFSDHWLRERLPERVEFELVPLSLTRLALWSRSLDDLMPADVTHASTVETAERVVAPCLAAVGYTLGTWMTLRDGLWSSDDDLMWQLPKPAQAEPDVAAPSPLLVAVCPWQAPLDSPPGAASSDGAPRRVPRPQSPALRLLRLLTTSDARWGVLTNGRLWRLYARSGDALEAYYEVDLVALAARRSIDNLKYFSLFFGAHAHMPPEGQRDTTFLDVALAESRSYAAGIEGDLRVRAFDAISAACQGIAEALAAERGIPSAQLARDDLRSVYADALALLYRLLFVLYAESRELLPVTDERYARDFSLRDLIARLPATLPAAPAAPPSLPIWPRLSRLFRALNGDAPDPAVPAYSGRLFDPDVHPLLSRLVVPDEHLARMLVLLGRTRDGRQIDYADLAVRQLGSIYEGLLEHQAIAVAVEQMALVKGPKDKSPVIVPLAQASGRRVLESYSPGTVYLSNDRGERHAAGTYYTPEPVVRYLVEQTFAPLTEGANAAAILQLKVLDPAMGSGHFLVAAVDYLARAILAASARASSAPAGTASVAASERAEGQREGSDVLALKRQIAEQCVYGVDINESAVELAKLSLWLATAAKDRPLTFLDLHLRPGNSLIGLAPTELERAAQSFPIAPRRRKRTSVSSPGRSAARRADSSENNQAERLAEEEPSEVQVALWDDSAFTRDMFLLVGGAQQIDYMETQSIADVRTKAHLLTTLEPRREPYRRVANLYVSLRFGNHIGSDVYAAAVKKLLGQGGVQLPEATLAPVLAEARRVAEREHVFHWELEFPEVFRDAYGRPLGASAGFDAILGNPPYVSVTTLREADPEAWQYYPQVFETTTRGQYDLYVAFVERALALLNARGRMAYILPNKWLTADFGGPLRDCLSLRRCVTALVDFRAYQVFAGVSNYTCLLFLSAQQQRQITVMGRTAPNGDISLPPASGLGSPWVCGSVEASTVGSRPWNLTVGSAQAILDQWTSWPQLGGEARVFQGTGTRADSVFILTERARADGIVTCHSPALGRPVRIEAALLRPVLQGRDIQPYDCDDHGARLLFPYRLVGGKSTLIPAADLADEYPLAWAYLNDDTIRAALEGREKGRFQGRPDWYGFGRPQNMDLLSTVKLVLPDVAARGRVAYDAAGRYIVDTAYGIATNGDSPYAPHFLLAVLNSPVLTFFLRHRGTDLRGGYFRMKTAYLNPFPLPPLAGNHGDAPSATDRRAQAAWATDQVLAQIRAGGPHPFPPFLEGRGAAARIAASLAHLPPLVLHDVVSALAEHVSRLAERQRERWEAFVSVVREQCPANIAAGGERIALLLAFEQGRATVAPDELLAALAAAGAPLSAPALAAIRSAFRDSRLALKSAASERVLLEQVTDRLIYRLYGLSDADVSIIEGQATTAAGEDVVPSENQDKRRAATAPGGSSLTLEVESAMRTVAKGGQPEHVITCIERSLENPYSDVADMNAAMGYIRASQTGPHYLNITELTGLLDQTPREDFRPTASGRALYVAFRHDHRAIWRALLGLPAYRRYLESQVLSLFISYRPRNAQLAAQLEAATYEVFPAFRSRAESLRSAFRLEEHGADRALDILRNPAALEPVAWEALRGWAGAQGLGSGKSELTRIAEIAGTLADAAEIPLHLDAEWLRSVELLAVLLLVAARRRGQGVIISRFGTGMLTPAVENLRRGGVDIRLETRGGAQVAALVPAVSLRIRDARALMTMLDATRSSTLAASAALVSKALGSQMQTGADGMERAYVNLDELALRCGYELSGEIGELVGHSAADEMPQVASSVTIGSPAPLASDLGRAGAGYRFLDEAVRVSRGSGRPGIAVLLTDWLLEHEAPPRDLLAINPHLALLYLIAADVGAHAELLSRHDSGWYLQGAPLISALDDRLRRLGYEVWDERYRDREELVAALGLRLVEQGLRSGVLEPGDGSASPLEAPSSYGYYDASELLTVEPAGRPTR